MKQVLLWIGVLVFGAYGAVMAWTAAAFGWVMTANAGSGGIGAVSAGFGPLLLIFWVAGIAVNRMVVARARAAGGLARRLHKSHLALAFLFAAAAIATLGSLLAFGSRFDSRTFTVAIFTVSAIFALHFLVLAAALALLARNLPPSGGRIAR